MDGPDIGAVELTDLHRFNDPAEAAATVGIREGNTEALDFYFRNERVTSGASDSMLQSAYQAWAQDTANGLTSLLIAGSNRDVTALNARARLHRVTDGEVESQGVDLRDGTTAGVGDLIVTRKNQRHLTNRRGNRFVKNGYTWTVLKRHRDKDLTVKGSQGRPFRLDHHYIAH